MDLSLRDGFEGKGNDGLFSEDFREDSGFGGGGDMPLERHNALLNSLTDFDGFLKVMVSEWLGLFWDEEQEKYVRDKGVCPVMNVQGVRWCINFLRVYARKNNIITRIGRDEYNSIVSDVSIKTICIITQRSCSLIKLNTRHT